MRAIIVDPSAPAALRLADVPEPVAGPSQVLLEVHHASLNHGDLNDARSGRVAPGGVLGSDAAGVVAHAAADGRGPAAGTRVVALAPGAFAERSAVEVGALAEVPPSVDLAEAAASPVAGDAALRALRAAGAVLGKQGADHRRIRRGRSVRRATGRARGCACHRLGRLGGPRRGPPKSLTSFLNDGEAGAELATLVQLVAAGRLAVEVGWRGAWEQVAEAAQALLGRRVNGKAVLDVRPAAG